MASPLHHSLQRSLTAMTIGTIRHVEARRAGSDHLRFQERFQQFQVPISGTAYQGVAWTKRPIDFDVVFHGATGQRDVPFDYPQVSYGFVVEPGDAKAPVLPIIPTLAIEWVKDNQESIRGCVAHIGVHSPTPDPIDFEGNLHITFQGWGSPLEDESEGD